MGNELEFIYKKLGDIDKKLSIIMTKAREASAAIETLLTTGMDFEGDEEEHKYLRIPQAPQAPKYIPKPDQDFEELAQTKKELVAPVTQEDTNEAILLNSFEAIAQNYSGGVIPYDLLIRECSLDDDDARATMRKLLEKKKLTMIGYTHIKKE